MHGSSCDSARHYGRHWHDAFGVELVEQGGHSSSSARGNVSAYAGDLITSNPGEVHDGRTLGGTSRRWRILYIEPSAMASIKVDTIRIDAATISRIPVIQDPELRAALLATFSRADHWERARSGADALAMACDEALADTLALLTTRYATVASDESAGGDMKRVRHRLADEALEPPTLSALAAMTGLSPYQVLRRFKAVYGIPPHAWRQQQRAERGRKLIRGGVCLAEVAASCGFADQSHLSRVFMRQFGFTPGAWQRATVGRTSLDPKRPTKDGRSQ